MKRIVTILLIVCLLSTAVACSSSQPAVQAPAEAPAQAPAQSGGEAAAPVAEGEWSRAFEGESLTFLDVSPSDTRTAYFENLFARFHENTGIEVKYQSVPWHDAADKLTVLGASNSLPDVLTVWSRWLGQFTQSG